MDFKETLNWVGAALEQKKTLAKWFSAVRWTYNKAVEFHREHKGMPMKEQVRKKFPNNGKRTRALRGHWKLLDTFAGVEPQQLHPPTLLRGGANQSEGQELQVPSEVLYAVRLVKGTRLGHYYLCGPQPLKLMGESRAREHRRREAGIIALDPGVRTFMTTYNGCGEVTEWGNAGINETGKL
ncbi:hypothetical protein QOT17_004366 [Balamuthia mandrillaris]